MIDKFQNVIIRHEKARQLVRDLKEKRSKLISECDGLSTIDCPGGLGVIEAGKTCLTIAFNDLMDTNKQNPGEYYSYSEILEEMHAGDTCCDACFESYKIKTGSLADAKKEFGNSKRQLSYIGKSILGNQ